MVPKTAEKSTRTGYKQADTQVVISPMYDDNFIIQKKVGEMNNIITPYTQYEGVDGAEWDSDFVVPENRLFRIQNFYENIKPISSYNISIDNISFNCLKNFPPDIFPPDAASGWLHFRHSTIITKNENDKKPTVVNQVDDRIIFEKIEDAEIDTSGIHQVEFENVSKINFKTKDLKVFPVIFDRGYALTIADEKKATLYLTLNDISKLYAGTSTQSELNNLIHNVFPLFPLFNCNVNEKNANIFLKNIPSVGRLLNHLASQQKRALVRFRYYFNKPTTCVCRVIGK